MSNDKDVYTVKVFRYDPSKNDTPYYDNFEVPYSEGETILGILHYIRENLDPSLTYRDSCAVGCCAICNVRVNGKTGMSCQEKALSKKLVIDPVNHDKVLKDLATI